jgi:hypothetical protein
MAQGASEASRQHCVNHGAISPQDHDGFRGRLFSRVGARNAGRAPFDARKTAFFIEKSGAISIQIAMVNGGFS